MTFASVYVGTLTLKFDVPVLNERTAELLSKRN